MTCPTIFTFIKHLDEWLPRNCFGRAIKGAKLVDLGLDPKVKYYPAFKVVTFYDMSIFIQSIMFRDKADHSGLVQFAQQIWPVFRIYFVACTAAARRCTWNWHQVWHGFKFLGTLGRQVHSGVRIPATSGTETLSGFTGKAPHIASSRFTSGLYCEKRILLINSSSLAEPLYPRSP